jgi:hypothetical protein
VGDVATKVVYEFWLQWGAVAVLILGEGAWLWLIWREYRTQLPKTTEALIEVAQTLADLSTLIRDRERIIRWDRPKDTPPPRDRRWLDFGGG